MPKNKIMYATDYSEASLYAFQFATWLARCTDAKLLIVHVSQAEQYPIGELFNDVPEVDQQALNRLKSLRPNDPDIQFEHRLLYGEPGSAKVTHPADVILKVAHEENVDMVVLGTHGRSGLERLLMGSVAETVTRHAECPVITIRPRRHATAAVAERSLGPVTNGEAGQNQTASPRTL